MARPSDLALLELCKEGWANESRTDGVTTTWRISIEPAQVAEIQAAFPHLEIIPEGHFLVTHEGTEVEALRFASEQAVQRVFTA